MKRFIFLIIIIILAAIVVPLVVANRHDVVVHIAAMGVDVSMPLYLVFFSGLLMGVVVMGVAATSARMKARLRAHRAEREAKRLSERLRSFEDRGAFEDEGKGRDLSI